MHRHAQERPGLRLCPEAGEAPPHLHIGPAASELENEFCVVSPPPPVVFVTGNDYALTSRLARPRLEGDQGSL